MAKAYFNRFKEKYPRSLLDLTNKDEGTATYVEARAKAISRRDCEIAEDELNRIVTEELRKVTGQHALIGPSSYPLSALASQALQVSKVVDWQKKVETLPRTPLEILLDEEKTDDLPLPEPPEGMELALCLANS